MREVRRREGCYLLRSSLSAEDPARIWHLYMLLVQAEQAFKDLKGDLAGSVILHQFEHRIEAYIFVAFLAFCLHATLRHRLHLIVPGLTPRSLIEQLSAIRMLDVHFPTNEGRTPIFTRYTAPDKTQKLLLAQLGLELPRNLLHASPPTTPRTPLTTASVVKSFGPVSRNHARCRVAKHPSCENQARATQILRDRCTTYV